MYTKGIKLKVLKAVLPVVCLSTRILSANKITPKELLPLFDTSIIQYAVNEYYVMQSSHLDEKFKINSVTTKHI